MGTLPFFPEGSEMMIALIFLLYIQNNNINQIISYTSIIKSILLSTIILLLLISVCSQHYYSRSLFVLYPIFNFTYSDFYYNMANNKIIMEKKINQILKESAEIPQTLLLVDTTPNEDSLTLFKNSAQYVVLDGKLMNTKKFVRNQTVAFLIEEARASLVYAMKKGKTLVIRLGDVAVDFRSTFNDDSTPGRVDQNPYPPYQTWHSLPSGFMMKKGELLRQGPVYPDSLLRRDDIREIQDGDCNAMEPEFQIILTTTIPIDQIDHLLFNGRIGLPGESSDYSLITLS